MDRAITKWRSTLMSQDAQQLKESARALFKTYTVYGTMLLLPQRTFKNEDYQGLLQHVADEMKITHIAMSHPIPPAREDGTLQDPHNCIRSPINFQPIYGDFGPYVCSSPPTRSDFEQAYWVIAKQNGIAQSWAPRWTMFSRGNISEKARVLSLPSVEQAVTDGVKSGNGCSVVDLYAGIGYFAFSYVKGGVDKVLCWELNEWSCEGLRRGALANRWKSTTYGGGTLIDFVTGSEQLVIFNETNELALQRINTLRACLPPIRHVNCGLLPSSRPSYPIALGALDPELGGWIHVHENFGISEIDARAAEVVDVFQGLLDEGIGDTKSALLESITRVKTYAPGVYHCVLDIEVFPT